MSEPVISDLMSRIVALCKRRGIIFQSSDIYGGIAGFWDYGPNGVAIKRSIERAWWQNMVEERDNIEGVDTTIICHPRVWEASGHVEQFSDSMTDCLKCKKRYRVDQLEEPNQCPACGSKELTEPREFNLMMKTYVGPVFDEDHATYLRAESCQPLFIDFNLVRIATRQQIPFGIAQTGKAFRNEINPRFFTFRSREFSQMEMEFFCKDEDSMEWYEYWCQERLNFYTDVLRIPRDKLRFQPHEKLAHYAKAAVDIEYEFPFGWGEIEGIHHRGTWDMERHAEFSGQEQDCKVYDQESKESYFPTIVETSCGLDRICLMMLCHAYDEDTAETKKADMKEDLRTVLRLPAPFAPTQVAVLPLSKKLEEQAKPVLKEVRKNFRATYDDGGSIGRRYRRQDEVGTAYCITVDFDTLEDNCVTIRDRDSMEQVRIEITKISEWLNEKINLS
jgi:glycyl-tRNA synthetase